MEKTDTSPSYWAELGSDNSLLQESCDDTTQVEIVEKDTDISEVTEDLSNLSLEETLQPRTSRRHGRPPPKFTYDVMGEPTVQMMTRTISTEPRACKSGQLNPLAEEFLPFGTPQKMVTTVVNAKTNIVVGDKEIGTGINSVVGNMDETDAKPGWLDWLMGKIPITRRSLKETIMQQI